MKYRHFAPLDRDLSVLVLGTAVYGQAPLDRSLELLDAWAGLGGNVIDTARHYGDAEAIVGRWLRERSPADVVVVTKGGHHDERTGRSRVTADDLAADFAASRRELGLDSIDVYLLHRDDPSRPAAAILEDVEPLRAHIRALGASNWTTERLEQAGSAFVCSSPGLSLAVPNVPPWPGVVTINDEAALDWYARTQLPVFAWSSLASGFFAGASDAHVERAYVSDANLERRRRATQLAAERGATPSQVALAWVLARPFPVHAVVGPRSIAELEESVEALELELSPDELRWLDLG